MLTVPIEIAAERVWRCLADQPMTVPEICLYADLDKTTDWPKVRDFMIAQHYSINYGHHGYYRDVPGAEIAIDYRRFRAAWAATKRLPGLRGRLALHAEKKTEGWDYLMKTYGFEHPGDIEAEKVKRVKVGNDDRN